MGAFVVFLQIRLGWRGSMSIDVAGRRAGFGWDAVAEKINFTLKWYWSHCPGVGIEEFQIDSLKGL